MLTQEKSYFTTAGSAADAWVMKIFEVPDGTRVSSVHLRTAKLARALDFDQRVLGLTLRERGESTASFSVTTTKHMKTAPQIVAPVDPEKMIAARQASASPWELHERALAREFPPFDPGTRF
jgi:hypothetical protein